MSLDNVLPMSLEHSVTYVPERFSTLPSGRLLSPDKVGLSYQLDEFFVDVFRFLELEVQAESGGTEGLGSMQSWVASRPLSQRPASSQSRRTTAPANRTRAWMTMRIFWAYTFTGPQDLP